MSLSSVLSANRWCHVIYKDLLCYKGACQTVFSFKFKSAKHASFCEMKFPQNEVTR